MQAHMMNMDTALLSTDMWNYIYNIARGVAGPAPETLWNSSADRNKLYSWAEYWAAMRSKGFNGFGLIANRVNPYSNPTGGNFKFGDNIRPNGMEMYITKIG